MMLKRRGFTLVEVLLVVVIIGILAAIVIPRITYSRVEAQRQACNANVAALNSQIELYRMQEGSYPAALSDLANSSANNSNESYIDAVPADPFAGNWTYTYNTTIRNRVGTHAH